MTTGQPVDNAHAKFVCQQCNRPFYLEFHLTRHKATHQRKPPKKATLSVRKPGKIVSFVEPAQPKPLGFMFQKLKFPPAKIKTIQRFVKVMLANGVSQEVVAGTAHLRVGQTQTTAILHSHHLMVVASKSTYVLDHNSAKHCTFMLLRTCLRLPARLSTDSVSGLPTNQDQVTCL